MVDGKRLRRLREELNLTPDEVAAATGISRQQILRYEANQTDMVTGTLVKLADFYGVTADYLLNRADVKHGYERRGHHMSLDISGLIKLSPKSAARLIRALNVRIEPEVLVIDPADLLTKLPPPYVAQFLDELGLPFYLAESSDSPDSPDS